MMICFPPRLTKRHALTILGEGSTTLLLVHGYGCSQAMWRFMAPELARTRRVVLMDLLGFGASDYPAYDIREYENLDAHARDVARVMLTIADGPVVLVGHSVGALINLIADLLAPLTVAAHVMVSPSPCFLNDGEYRGGFDRDNIDQLLAAQELNMEAWARQLALLVSGEQVYGKTSEELKRSFCLADPRAARQLARATFLADERAKLGVLTSPTLILQSAEDAIASPEVGSYMHRKMARSTLKVLATRGHCPHLTNAADCLDAVEQFLASQHL